MQNGSVASVNNIQPPAFQQPQFLPNSSSKPNSRPPSANGPPQLIPHSRGSSGTSSPAPMPNNGFPYQHPRPPFSNGPPSIDRSSVTPPFAQISALRPSSLPPSLSTSPTHKSLGSAHSTSHLSGRPGQPLQAFQPRPNGLPKMQPPLFRNQTPPQLPSGPFSATGPPSLQPKPPTMQPGPPTMQMQPGPPMMSSGPPSVQPRPPAFQHGPPTSQSVPPSMQPGPPMMQPGPPTMQPVPGPPKMQMQPGPPMMQPGPPTMQPGPPMMQPGPPMMQPGPPTMQPGPPTMQPGPPMMQPGPPTMQPGPPTMQPGPPTMQPAPPSIQPLQPPPEPSLPPTSSSNFPCRLGAAGLKAKRPVPVYNTTRPTPPPMSSAQGQPLPGQNDVSAAQPHNQPTQPPVQGMQPGQGGMPPMPDPVTDRMRKMSLSDMSYINLMEHRNIFPKDEKLTCVPPLPPDLLTKNKYPEHFCATTNVVPATSGMLSKLKIPFGLVIQPFKNLEDEIPVVNPPIPRCKVCRTYVNPYVQLSDGGRRWKCNICSRLNDMPADYFYGEDGRRIPFDIGSRAELNSALVEYIAPSEYTTRPPQAAIYMYLIDVSFGAIQSGMVKMACKVLEEEIDSIPGDSRTSVGIICFDSKLYYFNLHKNSGQPQMLVVPDIDEAFIPTIDDLMVNLKEHKTKIKGLMSMIPSIFEDSKNPDAAVGPILNAAKMLMFNTGGRISLLLSRSPSVGVGIAKKRGETSKLESLTLSPVDDFYKGLALECTQKQVTVDLFLFPNDNIDLPTISAASQFSSGAVFYYPQYHAEKNPLMAEKFLTDFRHYVTRPIAFEAVLRIRCTSGINIHSFFGNCFVRAHDLIALANVSPDVSFAVQTNIDDALHENKLAIFQSALLYTSAKGDRRIRVHTLGLPISSDPQTIYNNLNIDTCIALLSKLAVDKANSSSLGDAREALQYAVIDPLIKYRTDYCPGTKGSGQLVVPKNHRLLPLYISSLLKSKAFRLQSVSVDDRFNSMLQFKTLPVDELMLKVYPRLFALHNLAEIWTDKNSVPPRLSLTAEKLTRQGAFLLQTHEYFIIWIGRHISDIWVNSVYNTKTYNELPEISINLEHYDNAISDLVHDLISLLSKIRDIPMTVVSVREDSHYGPMFLQHLMEDRSDGQISYYEFLQKIQQQIG